MSGSKTSQSRSTVSPRIGEESITGKTVVEDNRKSERPHDDVGHMTETGQTRNRSSVTPEDYPKDDGGRPDYGSPKRKGDGKTEN